MGFATAMETLAGCAAGLPLLALPPARPPIARLLGAALPTWGMQEAASHSGPPSIQFLTMRSQAYGARNFRLVGVVYQRALLLTSAMAVLIALVWTQAEPLLLFFRRAGPGPGPGSWVF